MAMSTEKKSTTIVTTSAQNTSTITGKDDDTPKLEVSAVEKFWILEAGCWIVALAVILGLAGFLKVHDLQPAPHSLINKTFLLTFKGKAYQFQPSVTVNSIIALFNTVFKIALFVPVTAALAQLKWTWFAEGHPLSDFQVIDKSRNSIYGSLVLLWTFRGRRLACLGAVMTIAALSIEFGFQSLVKYRLHDFPVYGQAAPLMPQSYSYDYIGTGSLPVDPSMLAAMYAGFFDSSYFNVVPTCPTGNCHWDPYATVGVCSQCDDLTNQVIKSAGVYSDVNLNSISYNNFSLPSGMELTQDKLNLGSVGHSMLNLNLSTVYNGIVQAPFSDFSIIRVNEDATDAIFAAQCALFFCAKTFNGSVTDGTFSENVTNIFTNSSINQGSFDGSDPDSGPQDAWITPPVDFFGSNGSAVDFFVNGAGASNMNAKLNNWWSGNCSVPDGQQYIPCSSDFTAHLQSTNFSSLSSIMDNMATTMTNAMRIYSDPSAGSSTTVTGQAFETLSQIYVIWEWFILFAVLLLLCLVFLVATAITSANSHITLWKSNSLASFSNALTSDTRGQLRQAKQIKQVDEIASDLKVKIVDTNKGWRLVNAENNTIP